MSIATEIERLQTLKSKLRTKLVSMLGVASTATLEDCVTAIEGIAEQSVNANLDSEKTVYTVPAGYHNGDGEVSIVLETKSVTPTKKEQDITPTAGKVLTKVTVGAIPSNYGDVSEVDAAADNILAGKKYVDATGALKTGTMANNGAVVQTIDGTSVTSYTIPKGYHSGNGTISLDGTIEAALAAL